MEVFLDGRGELGIDRPVARRGGFVAVSFVGRRIVRGGGRRRLVPQRAIPRAPGEVLPLELGQAAPGEVEPDRQDVYAVMWKEE